MHLRPSCPWILQGLGLPPLPLRVATLLRIEGHLDGGKSWRRVLHRSAKYRSSPLGPLVTFICSADLEKIVPILSAGKIAVVVFEPDDSVKARYPGSRMGR